ncbi:MAG: hypothetical protein EOQ34_19880 [Mesorhizobium sp.]|uniref:hypothetical protein n=1 Tax=Mesorhizobium sp. TaxID=1871066 RepID=UPI000FE57D19|nr:hypothetical protein [Mesorhizobium sp.]RWF70084.1 MAG: hypothetical protein EOQ34_19880 [Mesorhizobium sp.]TIN82264.1 MAG: hypothetical protein E5X97_31025 [Mesorhizobium sp.]
MATIFNEQRVLGVRIVADGTTMYNGLPVIGLYDAGAVLFGNNLRTLSVSVISTADAMYNDQPVRGAVVISDGRKLYNGMLVLPATGLDPFSMFTVDIDYVAGTAKGGTQPYGNNTNDGRLFRDPSNVVACFLPDAAGVYQSLGAAGIRRTTKGAYNYPSATVRNLWGGDLTNAAWVKTNMTAAKDQPGIDGAANAASSLLATAANATALQTIVLASSTQLYQVCIKRLIGTGPILMTIDGTNFTDITAQITGGANYAIAFMTLAAVTNPVIGFKIATSGDKIAVDCNMTFAPPVATQLVPREDLVRTAGATILNSQSRPSADIADAAPNTLINIARGPFAFYHECTSLRPTGGFLITGATGIFISVDATQAGAVKFNANAGQSITVAGKWKSDGVGINRVAGFFTADGRIKVACNGALGNLDTDATVEAALDHFDQSTNGAGTNSLYSWTRRFCMGANLEFSDAQLLAMAA